MPHSLHSALIRSQTARENKSTRHISWPTLNNLECKNETVTMSSWVFFFFHYIVCFYIQTDFIWPDWNLLTWFKFFVGRWEVFFQKKKKKFNTRTGKFHIFWDSHLHNHFIFSQKLSIHRHVLFLQRITSIIKNISTHKIQFLHCA